MAENSKTEKADRFPRMIWLLPIMVCTIAVSVQFNSVIFSGLRYTHGGLGDSRLVNYTLEHGYRSLRGAPQHESFWNPPIFYPQENISSYTDFMLGFGPMYWLWRAFGIAVDTSFQLWILTVYALNFAAAFALMRFGVRAGPIPSTFGAVLLAISSVRFISHPQMFPMFYVLLGILALLRALEVRDPETTRTPPRRWIALFFSCAVAQAWGAVYSFFFFGLLCSIGLLVSLPVASARRALLSNLRRHWRWWAGCATGALLLLAPLLSHYLLTANELGYRNYHEKMVPRPGSWFLLGSAHWLYGSVLAGSEYTGRLYNKGAGLIAIVVASIGLFRYRERTSVRVLSAATLGFALIATRYGTFSPWRMIYSVVPGANGLRALDRATIVLLPLIAVGFTLACERFLTRKRWILTLPVLILVVGESVSFMGCRDKHQVRAHMAGVVDLVDPDCEAFFLVGVDPDGAWMAEDASWAGLATGKPTINGRYGNRPAQYRIPLYPTLGYPNSDGLPITREYLEEQLVAWLEENDLRRDRIQWIEYQPMTKHQKEQESPSPISRAGFLRTIFSR